MRSTFVLALLSAGLTGCFLLGGDDTSSGGPDGGTGSACATAADCAAGLVCAADVCIVPGSVGIGASCSANRDCATGLQCAGNGVCAPAGGGIEGTPCASGADCRSELRCELDGLGGTCQAAGTGDVGATCTSTADCLAGLACAVGGVCDRASEAYPPFTGVTCAPDQSPFRAFFEVPRPGQPVADFYRLPYPNDARIKADGTLDLSDFPRPGQTILGVDLVSLYTDAAAADFAGFPSIAVVSFRFSSGLDFASIQDGSPLFMVDITTPGAPGFGANRSRAFGYDPGRGKFACQNRLTLGNRTTEPLEPGHTYAAWVSTAARGTGGAAPIQDPDLVAVLGDTQPTDPTLARVWTQYANFRAYLTAESRAATDVATVAVFTVADASSLARKLAAQVAAAPAPTVSDLTLCDGTTPSPCAPAGDAGRACGDSAGAFWELQGRLDIPNYQAGTLPYERPADGGAIAVDGAGAPVVQGRLGVCFAMTIPKGTMPAGGWPLVVHAHGTGGNYRAAITNGVADALATAATPMATFTFDGVGHGERRGTSSRTPDSLVFNIVNPRAARDNHLQGAVDVLTALRLGDAAPATVPMVGAVSFDPARTYFFGHSQGSNVGIPATAVTDRAPAVILSGAGSVLVEGILGKTQPVDARAGLEFLIGEPLGGGHPVMALWQMFFDRIDPVNYAPMLIKRPPPGVASKHVWMSWGKGDSFSPEATLTATAAAAGLVQAAPTVTPLGLPPDARPIDPSRVAGDGPTRFGAVFQYDPAGAFDGHFVSTQSPAAVADWLAFLESMATTGTPHVP
ncbi:MAG: hypothetical protein R3B06_09575 [Kofleriaceae bacterium]